MGRPQFRPAALRCLDAAIGSQVNGMLQAGRVHHVRGRRRQIARFNGHCHGQVRHLARRIEADDRIGQRLQFRLDTLERVRVETRQMRQFPRHRIRKLGSASRCDRDLRLGRQSRAGRVSGGGAAREGKGSQKNSQSFHVITVDEIGLLACIIAYDYPQATRFVDPYMITQQIPHAATISALRTRIRSWRDDRLTVGFVPTMGALHDGHLSLVRLAKAQCDRVVASIFVNPKQFAPGEDLDAYPRTLMDDAEKLTSARCDLIYLPTPDIMYPAGFSATVALKGPALGLETDIRPHFFDGVATVVAKLFNQVRPDMAFFGEKDYQQLLVIRQLVKDLDFSIDILAGATGRDRDGLALSSRNAYLTADERARAGQLNIILKDFAKTLETGTDRQTAEAQALKACQDVFDSIDYIEARCADTLAVLAPGPITGPTRILAAVRLGSTRLIDNMAANPPL